MPQNPPDKYSALWVSHSSMGDFLKCPRAYFLHNVYRSPQNRKINIVSPALSLGQAVHETLEGLLKYKAEDRFKKSLLQTFEENWQKVSGKLGGFKTKEEEQEAKNRAQSMILRADTHRGPLAEKAIRLKEHKNNMPPNIYLSEEDNIILSGKIDWLQYIEADDSVRVLDFKTGKNEEDKESLQLPIYVVLLSDPNIQTRKVSGVAYWYLDKNNEPTDMPLPDVETSRTRILEVARKVKQAREENAFACPRGAGGCFACRPYEAILAGRAEFIGLGGYNQEMYIV